MDTDAILEDTLKLTESNWGDAVILDFGEVTGHPELPGDPAIEVTGETVQDAALRFRGKRVTVLNFASGTMPGGGTRWGSLAQEECLCLCSGLLYGLESHMAYYERNRAGDAPHECYDQMIWSENVPLVREGKFNRVEPMLINVITYPAPVATKRVYTGSGQSQDLVAGDMVEIFERRCRHVVRRAEKAGTEVLILGAWGCGAYGNDPAIVGRAFQDAVKTQAGSIERVVYAVYGTNSADRHNRATFGALVGVETPVEGS